MHSTNLLCKLARVHHYQYFTSKYQASERMKLCMILVFVYFPHPSLMKFPPPTFKAFSASAMSALIPSAASSNLSICSWNRYSDVTTLVIGNFVWHRHWFFFDWWCFIILLWCCLKKGIACWVSNLLVAISVEEQQKVFTSWSSKAIRVFMPASFASAHISLILRVHSSVSSDFSLIVSWRPSSESGSGLSGNMIVENTLSENRPGRRWSFFFVTHGQCLWNDASD